MPRERETRRFRIAMAICLLIGLIEAFLLMSVTGNFAGGGGNVVVSLVITLLLGAILGVATWFFPYAIIVLGIRKLFEQRKEVMEQLGDENVVHADPDGERKLHEYLTAITSVEARIGLIQRSETYVPSEQRPPADAKPPRARLNRAGQTALVVTMGTGAVVGAFYAAYMGVGDLDSEKAGDAMARNVGVLRLFVCSMIGAALALPVGLVCVLIFGRVEQPPEEEKASDDTGRSGPETA